MSSEELQGNDLHSQAQAPAPAPIPMPPYPEMILAAIEALNEENGSNKSSISKHIAKYIEATYGPIPPAHSALLNHHRRSATWPWKAAESEAGGDCFSRGLIERRVVV